MPKLAEQAEMSSVIPKGLSKKLGRFAGKHLSLGKRDAIAQFWVQTRLLFSRSIMLMVVGLFVAFAAITLEEGRSIDEDEVYGILLWQTIILSIMLHMNLWETEREAKTFELLLMRIPNTHRLIWFKLRVSFLWAVVLGLPLFAGLSWFVSIPLSHGAVYVFFSASLALLVALFTCVIASFVHRGLPSAIIALVLMTMVGNILEHGRFPYKDFYRPFLNPFDEDFERYALLKKTWLLVVNRLVVVTVAGCLYWWLHERLKKTERWIH